MGGGTVPAVDKQEWCQWGCRQEMFVKSNCCCQGLALDPCGEPANFCQMTNIIWPKDKLAIDVSGFTKDKGGEELSSASLRNWNHGMLDHWFNYILLKKI
jgi:hypothetical protein